MVNALADLRRYRAFISYSHADRGEARWLHRRLESYAMPKRLVGRAGVQGSITTTLRPIFKDREDLPAAHDLTAEVRAALKASGCLIILCTPSAAASPYVNQEITLFRALHPDLPILAALFDGEPGAAFPSALRIGVDGSAVEPLAADFRKSGDGRRLALLKIIAGVAGVDLDALVQRDAQRRLRRVMAITVAAVLAMLVMALLTIFAFNARAEAERQHEQAEGLVEFMLTDLRDRLKGVGRLDVMTSANTRAMAYYAAQDVSRLPPESLERRARLLQAMGADNEKRGDLAAASKSYAEAKRVTAAQLAADPNNPERIFADAQSDYWTGHIDELRGNFSVAEAAYRQYRADAERLLAIDPASSKYMTERAYAETNLGIVALNGFKRPARAVAAFSAALRWFELARRLDPDNIDLRFETANSHAWLGDANLAGGDLVAARQHRLANRAILTDLLAADPRNLRFAHAAIVSDRALAAIDRASGDRTRATATLTAANTAIAALLAADPTNLDWQEQAARVDKDRAQILFDAGQFEAATVLLRQARQRLLTHENIAQNNADISDLLKNIDDQLEEISRKKY